MLLLSFAQERLRRNRGRQRGSGGGPGGGGGEGGDQSDSLSGLLMVPGADFDFGSAASAITFVAAVSGFSSGAASGSQGPGQTGSGENSSAEESSGGGAATAREARLINNLLFLKNSVSQQSYFLAFSGSRNSVTRGSSRRCSAILFAQLLYSIKNNFVSYVRCFPQICEGINGVTFYVTAS